MVLLPWVLEKFYGGVYGFMMFMMFMMFYGNRSQELTLDVVMAL